MNKTASVTLALCCAFLALVGSRAKAEEIHSGDVLIRAMHDRYQNTWYHTINFWQKSTTYKSDGTSQSETWYEAGWLPGKLRIDIGPPGAGNGMVFANDTLTSFKEGKVAATRPYVHVLLMMAFDVYVQDPETTMNRLKEQGFDLSKFHEDTWDGEPVYVVGAQAGDLKSKQFWIEKKRLVLSRMIEASDQDKTKIRDIRMSDFRELSGGWVAAKLELYMNGEKVFGEDYADIQGNPKLDPAMFDPAQYNTTHWEK
jgi:hypothetical protein